MNIPLPPVEDKVKRHYSGDSLAARLESRMFEKEILSIGSPLAWKNLVNQKGEERLSSLDMSKEARAYRTLDIRSLSMDELKKVHRRELKYMTRFLIGPSEMRIVTGNSELKDQFYLQPNQLEAVEQFNNAHRPLMNRQFLGLTIPPYFSYDHEFDGMIYHHAWDLSVWNGSLSLPFGKDKKVRASDAMQAPA